MFCFGSSSHVSSTLSVKIFIENTKREEKDSQTCLHIQYKNKKQILFSMHQPVY